MELVCEKYQEKIDSEKGCLPEAHGILQIQEPCLLHFLGREKAGEEKKEPEDMGGEGK